MQPQGLDPESPPETFEEIVENAKLLTDKSKNQYGFCVPVNNNITAQYTMYAYGGGYVNEDETKAEFNSEANAKPLTHLRHCMNVHLRIQMTIPTSADSWHSLSMGLDYQRAA